MSPVRALTSDPDLLAAGEDPARCHTACQELVASEMMRSAALEELHARLSEQREQLRVASEHHQRQLSRLRDRSDKLRVTTGLSAFGRLARGVDEVDGWPGSAERVPEPAPAEEREG